MRLVIRGTRLLLRRKFQKRGGLRIFRTRESFILESDENVFKYSPSISVKTQKYHRGVSEKKTGPVCLIIVFALACVITSKAAASADVFTNVWAFVL